MRGYAAPACTFLFRNVEVSNITIVGLSILCLAMHCLFLGQLRHACVYAKPHWTPILAEGRGSVWTFGDSGPLPQYYNWQHQVPPKDFYDPSGVPAGDVMGIFTFKQAHVHSESYTNDSHHPGEIGARWSWAWVDDNGLPLTSRAPHRYTYAARTCTGA